MSLFKEKKKKVTCFENSMLTCSVIIYTLIKTLPDVLPDVTLLQG